MWICSQLGFFSIVQKVPGEYHLRARLRPDLVSLSQALGWDEGRILETQGDYRFRIIADQAQVLAALEALGRSLDYSNFKGRIASLPGQRDKLGAYHGLWHSLYDLQEAAPDRPGHRRTAADGRRHRGGLV